MSDTQFTDIELLLHRLYVLKAQGCLDAIVAADKTGTIQKALSSYSLSVERFNEIDDHLAKGRNRNHAVARDLDKAFGSYTLPQDVNAAASELVKTLRPARHLSYFERQLARSLGKSVDSFGNIRLDEGSNQASGQSRNRNFAAANASTEQFFGKTESAEILAKAELIKARSECAQRCVPNGRSWCRYCGGEGWVRKTTREGNPSRNVNKPRFLMAKNRNSSKV